MTRRHKLCQRHLYNDRKQRALPSIRKTPTNYADCPYQLRRNGTIGVMSMRNHKKSEQHKRQWQDGGEDTRKENPQH